MRLAPQFRSVLTPLKLVDYRRLLLGNFLWWQTRWMEMIILGWVVLLMTDSAWQVALVAFYRTVPTLVMGTFAGNIIDRLGRYRTIIAAQTLHLVISLGVAGLLWLDALQVWHIAVASLILGVAWSVDWPARRSFIPDLVGKEQTLDAMLLENFAQSSSRVFGPFAGGTLMAVISPLGGYVVLNVFSVLALISLLGIKPPKLRQTPVLTRPATLTTIRESFSYVRRTPPILGAFLITIIMNFLVFPYETLLPVFARDVLGQDAFGLGLLGTSAGVGAVIGLLGVTLLRRHVSPGWIFGVGSTLQAAALLGFALSTSFELSLGMLLLSGMGQACFSIMQSGIVLLAAEDDMRSRSMGLIVLGIGSGPLGRLQIGALAEGFGAPLAVGGHMLIATLAVIGVIIALPAFRVHLEQRTPIPKT